MSARRRRSGFAAWASRRPKPALFVLGVDIVLLGISLLVFALFHHVLPSREQGLGKQSSRDGRVVSAAATAAPSGTSAPGTQAVPTPTPVPTPAPTSEVRGFPYMAVPSDKPAQTEEITAVGYFGNKYADKFTSGEPIYTRNENGFTYVSKNINLTFTTVGAGKTVYHVADFYIRDISNLSTAFAKDTFGKGQREKTPLIAQRAGALLAVNGDYYGHGSSGIVIRNGTLYRDNQSGNDVCALFWDGTMRVYNPGRITGAQLIEQGAYQSWDFGPGYLDEDGQPKTAFNSSVGPANPRTVLGYYEPGHYCFVCVDGRSDYSRGYTNTETSKLMASLGCKVAYNLDGGRTSVMTWMGNVVNKPELGGRETSDIVLIKD